MPPAGASTAVFVQDLLRRKFGSRLSRRSGYRFMFESATERVYFQNFNKLSAEHLWYRVSEGPWKHLQSPTVTAWLALTNPADRIAYLIPVSAIQQRIKQTGWSRDYLEININPVSSRWTELDWKIEQFLLEL